MILGAPHRVDLRSSFNFVLIGAALCLAAAPGWGGTRSLEAIQATAPAGQSASQPTRAASLRAIPEYSTNGMEPAVRDQLHEEREELERALGSPQNNPALLAEQFLGLGQLFLLYDLGPAAEAVLRNAIDLAPQDLLAHYLLGTLLDLDGRANEAAEQYRQVLARRPQDAPARARLAAAELAGGKISEAKKLYESLVSVPGFEAIAEYGIGRAALERKEWGAAAEHLARALERQPTADILHYHLGVAFREMADRERARFHFANRGEQEVRFPDPAVYEVQGKATGVGALLSLGRLSIARGALDVAEERYAQALALDPENKAALVALAGVKRRRGDVLEAIALYERAIAKDPEDAGLRLQTASLRNANRPLPETRPAVGGETNEDSASTEHPARLRAWDEATRDHLERALARTGDYVPAWVELAQTYDRLGDAAAADRALSRAQEFQPQDPAITFLRVQSLQRLGNRETALQQLQEWERLSSSLPLPGETRWRAAELFADLGRPLDALRQWAALAADTSVTADVRARAALGAGRISAERGDTQSAISHFRYAVDLQPQVAEARFNLATMLARAGRFREAAEQHGLLVALQPENHEARYSEALALLLSGQEAASRQKLEDALARFPDMPAYAHLLTRILVAAEDPVVRDAPVGLDLAYRLFQAFSTPEYAETVAMALAENQRWDEAVSWQERVIAEIDAEIVRRSTLGAPNPEKQLADASLAARRRLESYLAKQPIRRPWGP